MTKNAQPCRLTISERLYALLVWFYPKPFRDAFGTSMKQVFHDQCSDAIRQHGWAGWIGLWIRVLFDFAWTCPKEHLIALPTIPGRLWQRVLAKTTRLFAVDTNMNTNRKLALAALVSFVISHFLPAADTMSGIACFGECWNTLLGHSAFGTSPILSGGWFYYSGFVISSLLFVVLVVALFVTMKRRRLRVVASVLCFLQVLSWWILTPTSIKVGYYLWLIAYGFLVAAHFWKEPAESPEEIPLEESSESTSSHTNGAVSPNAVNLKLALRLASQRDQQLVSLAKNHGLVRVMT